MCKEIYKVCLSHNMFVQTKWMWLYIMCAQYLWLTITIMNLTILCACVWL